MQIDVLIMRLDICNYQIDVVCLTLDVTTVIKKSLLPKSNENSQEFPSFSVSCREVIILFWKILRGGEDKNKFFLDYIQ